MRSTVCARRLMRSTRAPPNPWLANSSVAASRILRSMPSGSRLRRGGASPFVLRQGARLALPAAVLAGTFLAVAMRLGSALQQVELVRHVFPVVGVERRGFLGRD